MKRFAIISSLFIFIFSLFFPACSSHHTEKEEEKGMATFTINLGGGRSRAALTYPPDTDPLTMALLKFTAKFQPVGGGSTIEFSSSGDDSSITGSIAVGQYNVTVDITVIANGSLFATGFAVEPATTTPANPVTIVEGSNSISVQVNHVEFTVTYDANGGSGAPSPDSVPSSDEITLPPQGSLLNSGSVFTGWNTKADGTGTTYAANASFTPIADTTLYAQWTQAYTVTFNSNGGTPTPSPQQIVPGPNAKVTAPSNPTRANDLPGLYAGTPPANYTFANWQSSTTGTTWNFNDVVTEDMTLTAQWTPPTRLVSGNDLVTAISTVNGGTGTSYTMWLDANVSVTARQDLTRAGVTLTLVGIGGIREIVRNVEDMLFQIGQFSGTTGTHLVLGNNITLRGNNYTTRLIQVNTGHSFTMESGSRITGTTGNDYNSKGAAVYSTGVFTMKSGATITGNTSIFTDSGDTTVQTAGVFIGGNSTFNMDGGSITGNTGTFDVYISQGSTIVLAGNATINKLVMMAANGSPPADTNTRSYLQVASGWSGNVSQLNFRGMVNGNLADCVTFWTFATIQAVQGFGGGVPPAGATSRFTLWNFVNPTNLSQPISPYYLNANGYLVP